MRNGASGVMAGRPLRKGRLSLVPTVRFARAGPRDHDRKAMQDLSKPLHALPDKGLDSTGRSPSWDATALGPVRRPERLAKRLGLWDG